ncbi:MAG: hypothetical protein ACK5Y2_12350 [Bdellovibrionales bacterium]
MFVVGFPYMEMNFKTIRLYDDLMNDLFNDRCLNVKILLSFLDEFPKAFSES